MSMEFVADIKLLNKRFDDLSATVKKFTNESFLNRKEMMEGEEAFKMAEKEVVKYGKAIGMTKKNIDRIKDTLKESYQSAVLSSKAYKQMTEEVSKTSAELITQGKAFDDNNKSIKKNIDISKEKIAIEKSLMGQLNKTNSSINSHKKSVEDSGVSLNKWIAHAQRLIRYYVLMQSTIASFRFGISVFDIGGEYEASMKALQGVSRATADGMKEVGVEIRRLGGTTEYTANEVALAARYLSMAGLNIKQTTEALVPTIDLATAGLIGLKDAADISTNILSAFGLEVSDLERVNSAIIGTITRTNSTVIELAEAMKYAAPVAKSFGYDIEEVAAFLGILHNAGIKGSMAGTQLARAMFNTGKAFSVLSNDIVTLNQKLGIGDTKETGLLAALDLIKIEGWSASKVIQVFGDRGARAALIFMDMGSQVIKLEKEIRSLVNQTAELAEQMRTAFPYALKELGSAVEEVKISIFENNVETATKVVNYFTSVLQDNKEAIVEFAQNMASVIKIAAIAAPIGVIAGLIFSVYKSAGAASLSVIGFVAALKGLYAVVLAHPILTIVAAISALTFAIWKFSKRNVELKKDILDLGKVTNKVSTTYEGRSDQYRGPLHVEHVIKGYEQIDKISEEVFRKEDERIARVQRLKELQIQKELAEQLEKERKIRIEKEKTQIIDTYKSKRDSGEISEGKALLNILREFNQLGIGAITSEQLTMLDQLESGFTKLYSVISPMSKSYHDQVMVQLEAEKDKFLSDIMDRTHAEEYLNVKRLEFQKDFYNKISEFHKNNLSNTGDPNEFSESLSAYKEMLDKEHQLRVINNLDEELSLKILESKYKEYYDSLLGMMLSYYDKKENSVEKIISREKNTVNSLISDIESMGYKGDDLNFFKNIIIEEKKIELINKYTDSLKRLKSQQEAILKLIDIEGHKDELSAIATLIGRLEELIPMLKEAQNIKPIDNGNFEFDILNDRVELLKEIGQLELNQDLLNEDLYNKKKRILDIELELANLNASEEQKRRNKIDYEIKLNDLIKERSSVQIALDKATTQAEIRRMEMSNEKSTFGFESGSNEWVKERNTLINNIHQKELQHANTLNERLQVQIRHEERIHSIKMAQLHYQGQINNSYAETTEQAAALLPRDDPESEKILKQLFDRNKTELIQRFQKENEEIERNINRIKELREEVELLNRAIIGSKNLLATVGSIDTIDKLDQANQGLSGIKGYEGTRDEKVLEISELGDIDDQTEQLELRRKILEIIKEQWKYDVENVDNLEEINKLTKELYNKEKEFIEQYRNKDILNDGYKDAKLSILETEEKISSVGKTGLELEKVKLDFQRRRLSLVSEELNAHDKLASLANKDKQNEKLHEYSVKEIEQTGGLTYEQKKQREYDIYNLKLQGEEGVINRLELNYELNEKIKKLELEQLDIEKKKAQEWKKIVAEMAVAVSKGQEMKTVLTAAGSAVGQVVGTAYGGPAGGIIGSAIGGMAGGALADLISPQRDSGPSIQEELQHLTNTIKAFNKELLRSTMSAKELGDTFKNDFSVHMKKYIEERSMLEDYKNRYEKGETTREEDLGHQGIWRVIKRLADLDRAIFNTIKANEELYKSLRQLESQSRAGIRDINQERKQMYFDQVTDSWGPNELMKHLVTARKDVTDKEKILQIQDLDSSGNSQWLRYQRDEEGNIARDEDTGKVLYQEGKFSSGDVESLIGGLLFDLQKTREGSPEALEIEAQIAVAMADLHEAYEYSWNVEKKLIEVSERQISATLDMIESNFSLMKSLENTRKSLEESDLNPDQSFQRISGRYNELKTLAETGGKEEIQEFANYASTYLEAAKRFHKSTDTYNKIFENVMDDLILTEAKVLDANVALYNAIAGSGGLIEINDKIYNTNNGIVEVTGLLAENIKELGGINSGLVTKFDELIFSVDSNYASVDNLTRLFEDLSSLSEENLESLADNLFLMTKVQDLLGDVNELTGVSIDTQRGLTYSNLTLAEKSVLLKSAFESLAGLSERQIDIIRDNSSFTYNLGGFINSLNKTVGSNSDAVLSLIGLFDSMNDLSDDQKQKFIENTGAVAELADVMGQLGLITDDNRIAIENLISGFGTASNKISTLSMMTESLSNISFTQASNLLANSSAIESLSGSITGLIDLNHEQASDIASYISSINSGTAETHGLKITMGQLSNNIIDAYTDMYEFASSINEMTGLSGELTESHENNKATVEELTRIFNETGSNISGLSGSLTSLQTWLNTKKVNLNDTNLLTKLGDLDVTISSTLSQKVTDMGTTINSAINKFKDIGVSVSIPPVNVNVPAFTVPNAHLTFDQITADIKNTLTISPLHWSFDVDVNISKPPDTYTEEYGGRGTDGAPIDSAEGNVISGPTSGYVLPNATFHGTEAIIPLKGMTLKAPVVMQGGGNSDETNELLKQLIDAVYQTETRIDGNQLVHIIKKTSDDIRVKADNQKMAGRRLVY